MVLINYQMKHLGSIKPTFSKGLMLLSCSQMLSPTCPPSGAACVITPLSECLPQGPWQKYDRMLLSFCQSRRAIVEVEADGDANYRLLVIIIR